MAGGHAGIELVHEVQGGSDFDGIGEVLRIEGDCGWLPPGGDGHFDRCAYCVVIAVGQGEVARCFPSEAYGVRLSFQ